MESVLLLLYVHPDLEDALIDVLLQQSDISGFTSHQVNGHGVQAAKLGLMEQVAGKQARLEFLIATERDQAQRLLATIKARFPLAEIHYFIVPVLEGGRL